MYAFADQDRSELDAWAEWMLTSDASPLKRFTPAGADIDSVFDVKVIYQQTHDEVVIERVPELFKPLVGPFQLTDYEKIYAANPGEDIFDIRELSRDGVIVVVRPDHYVAGIFTFDEREELADHFANVFSDQ